MLAHSMAQNLAVTSIVLLAQFMIGCESEVVPSHTTESRDAPIEGHTNVQSRSSISAADSSHDPPLIQPGGDLPTPTTAKSSADSTRLRDHPPILRAVRLGQSPG